MMVTVIWYWNLVYMLWSNFNTGLNLISLFFFGMFMYDNEFETMGGKIWTKNRIGLQHNYTHSVILVIQAIWLVRYLGPWRYIYRLIEHYALLVCRHNNILQCFPWGSRSFTWCYILFCVCGRPRNLTSVYSQPLNKTLVKFTYLGQHPKIPSLSPHSFFYNL